jgi:hypothetical protein
MSLTPRTPIQVAHPDLHEELEEGASTRQLL